ncbi:flagellar hook assembly protein FlgD [Peribacillus asahii]|uniref:flagellar hook assembly protein FlgD n=1 Tax=Peribacillus asahii TaxID=228899 RepID=UPI00207A3A49|nr:flagellar hook assembly protein FlgD [Peribacillus asahii]USK71647.1 flagellar hook assembly protein FlgD [Peribacillus asahii]
MTKVDTAIDSSLYLANKKEERKPGNNLGKDDFLKLLITQLQNQDPSSPMDNSQFIAQMAQFSTLEQMVNIGSKIDDLVAMKQQESLLNYSSFVGKEVTWHAVEESEGSEAEPTIKEGTGVIQSIQFKNDTVTFILEDGTKLEPGNISQINNTTGTASAASSNSLIAGSELIGKVVTWKNDEGTESSSLVKSVLLNNGKLQYELADGSTISTNQLIKITSA